MKKTKIIIPALGLLVLSTAASVSGTVAWFSMNTEVTATGMQVKAKAQEGLVISNAADGTYNASAASVKNSCAELYPASTYNFSTWLTSVSTNPGAANTQQAYTAATAWDFSSPSTPGYYVVHDYYIRSSSASALTVASLDVLDVSAKLGTGNPAAQELSKALRVGINFDGSSNKYIYAPITGFTATVSVQKAAGAYSSVAADRQDVTALAGSTDSNDTTVTSIPANTANGKHVYIYVWYEGEDAACVSNNIVEELETLSIEVTFGFTAQA